MNTPPCPVVWVSSPSVASPPSRPLASSPSRPLASPSSRLLASPPSRPLASTVNDPGPLRRHTTLSDNETHCSVQAEWRGYARAWSKLHVKRGTTCLQRENATLPRQNATQLFEKTLVGPLLSRQKTVECLPFPVIQMRMRGKPMVTDYTHDLSLRLSATERGHVTITYTLPDELCNESVDERNVRFLVDGR